MAEKRSLIKSMESEKPSGKEPFTDKEAEAAYAHVENFVLRSVNNNTRFKRDYVGAGPEVKRALNSYKASNAAQKHLKVLLHRTMHKNHKQFVNDMENIFEAKAKEKTLGRFRRNKSMLGKEE